MSAGTLVGRLGQALKSKLIPLGLCQAGQPDARVRARPLTPCRLTSASMCWPHRAICVTKGSAEKSAVHLYLTFKGKDTTLQNEDFNNLYETLRTKSETGA